MLEVIKMPESTDTEWRSFNGEQALIDAGMRKKPKKAKANKLQVAIEQNKDSITKDIGYKIQFLSDFYDKNLSSWGGFTKMYKALGLTREELQSLDYYHLQRLNDFIIALHDVADSHRKAFWLSKQLKNNEATLLKRLRAFFLDCY